MLNHYVASLRLFARLCAGGNNHAVRPFVRSAAAFTPLRRGVVALCCCRGSRPSLRSLAHIWRWSRSALSWPSRRCGLPVLWRYGGRRAAASGHCAAALHETALHGSARKMCCAALRGCAVYSVMRVCPCAGRVCCGRVYSARQVTVLRSLAPELAISFEDLLWLGFFYRVPPKARAHSAASGGVLAGGRRPAAADRCHLARRGAAGLSRRNRVPQVRKAAVELLIELYLDTGAANPDMVGSSAENVLIWCAWPQPPVGRRGAAVRRRCHGLLVPVRFR